MNVLQMISADSFIIVNKSLIKAFGIEAAILLGELASEAVYWANRGELEEGYFYSTVENVEERTTLTAYQQRKALAVMQERGVVDVISKKGSPPKRYIKINEQALLHTFNIQNLKNCTFESEKISLSNVKKLNTNNKEGKNNKKEKQYSEVMSEAPYKTEEFVTAVNDFVEMRKALKKPVTARGLKMLISKATELSNGNEGTVVELFNQSTANSWLGIYPLKNNYSYKNSGGKVDFMDMLKELENDEEGNATGFDNTANSLPERTY